MLKKFGILILIIILIICGSIFFALQKMNSVINQPMNLTYNSLSLVDNGVYVGSVNAGLIQVVVEVNVENHVFVSIDLISHQNGLGSKANKIVDTMVKENRIDVDTITSATYSSKCIQLAVYQALFTQ